MPREDQWAALAATPEAQPQLLLSNPGVVRDGTRFSHVSYIDSQWNRFWMDKPKKMGGYREQVRSMDGVGRHLNLFNDDGFCYVHVGSTEAFMRYAIYLPDGTNTLLIDRTPAGYVASADNMWVSDTIVEVAEDHTHIFAAPVPALNDITSSTPAQVYHGGVTEPDVLTAADEVVAASTDYIAFAQTLGGPGFLVLNVNAPIPTGAGNVSVTTDGNLTAVNATIEGTDLAGAPLTVGPFALPDTATYDTGSQFATVTSVALDAGTGADNVSVGFLEGSNPITTSGGLCTVGPYLFLYGHDGIVKWSVPGFPHDFNGVGAGDSRPVSDKIIKAMPLRGQQAPAIIMWSLSSLIIGNFVGGTTLWDFYTVSTSGSMLSQNGVVEHNGIYYWASTNGFTMYSGAMQDISNEYNQNFFLDNLNFAQRQKVFAVKVPRWKEIWWCFPFGTATECNWAVIYNYEKGYWYDTPLPNGGRGAGYYDVTYRYPIMTGVVANDDTAGTSIWQHEIGVDEISGPQATTKAVEAFFQTNEFTMILPTQLDTPAATNQIAFSVIEPDYNQVGNLTLDIYSRTNARQASTFSPPWTPITIPEAPTDVEPDGLTFQWEQRLTSFRVTSNVAGGDYFAGSPLIHMKAGRKRRAQ